MQSGEPGILRILPVVVLVWIGTLVGVVVLALHAVFKDLPWMNQ